MPDDPYLTVGEFAALTSDQHHAIWHAHALKRIDTIPEGSIRRYRRAQADEILRELEESRG